MPTHAVETLAAQLDKPVATIIVSQDDRTRRFIGEALLITAAVYLLKRYVDKYLEGLGFDDVAKEHGRKTKEFFKRLREGSASPQDIDNARADLDAELTLARSKSLNEDAKSAALTDLSGAILEAGALRAQAKVEAAKVAAVADAALSY